MQVAAQLQHPHIVPLLSAGEQDDLLYFTMPFIKGESLKTAIEKDGGMSVPEVVRFLYHVGEALDYAHEAGIVHRDIKPANILRSGSYALITDFGVAKALNAAMSSAQQAAMTATGMAIGTPAYMAPEQLAGDSTADHRVDIYAVGLLAYELLHGKSPFAAATPQRMLAAVLTEDPKPLAEVEPEVPQALSDLVMRCLAKEPNQRPANAKELLNALDSFSNDSGEIRTVERRFAPIPQAATPTSDVTPVIVRDRSHTTAIPEPEPPAEVEPAPDTEAEPVAGESLDAELLAAEMQYGRSSYEPPKKSRTGMFAGIVGVAALATLGAFLWSQRGGDGAALPDTAPPTAPVAIIPDSAAMAPPAVVTPESTVAIVPVDSQAIRDSLRRVARAEAAKKKAAAQADSLKKAQQARTTTQSSQLEKARGAIAAVFSNAYASGQLAKGATGKGGLLGTRKTGDLQTQIDAIVPFLRQAGVSYEQFKVIVRDAGIDIFDEDGRMIPAQLRRFSGG
jgi:serine/threonine-protein kinase